MKKCPYCQKGNDDEEIQCWNCGEWFETVSPPKQRNVVKPPEKKQSVTDPVDWQTKLGSVFKKYIIPIISIIIIAEILFIISQIAYFKKNTEQVARIEPQKIDAPVASPPESAPALESAPAPESDPTPGLANNLLNNALALCSSGKCTDPQKAIEYLNEAIKLKPDFSEAYNNRGKAYDDLGERQQAITDYNEAIRLKPDLADAYYNRGKAYGDLGQHQQAIIDYNEAIRLKPDYALAYNNRGVAYFLQSSYDLGCPDAQKACALGNCQLLEWAKDKRYCR